MRKIEYENYNPDTNIIICSDFVKITNKYNCESYYGYMARYNTNQFIFEYRCEVYLDYERFVLDYKDWEAKWLDK